MPIDEQDDAIGEDGGELREARVTLRWCGVRRHGAAGERLEAHQHPERIVGDFEHEAFVAGERKDDAGAFGFVSEWRWRRRQDCHERQGHLS